MKIVTAEQMRAIDKKTIEGYGIPGSVLMERAGLAVAKKVSELFADKKVVVLCGGGNNGGDGVVAARNLFDRGWKVELFFVQKEKGLSPDCLAQYKIAKKMGIPIKQGASIDKKDLHGAVVVDALLGTGINKAVTPPLSDIIAFLNKSNAPVISVDIPSGVSSDNGQIMGEAVRADYTVTFGLAKTGHFLHPGAACSGELFIEDIGFPEELLADDRIKTQTVERRDAGLLIPERTADSHKGDYGHVLVVAGSRGKTGAALMAARACLRSGAGMVTLGVPETLVNVFQGRVTEEMVLPLADNGQGILSENACDKILDFLDSTADVLATGPGLTTDNIITSLMEKILKTSTSPMVLDADAINSIAGKRNVLNDVKAPVVLTPHTGEMARILGRKSEFKKVKSVIEKDRIATARTYACKNGIWLVLKGAPTVVSEPEGRVFVNTTGNPGMATAGSGDVLTGIIASFLGQGLNPLDASVLGVYIHGLAGDIASSVKGMHSVTASDMIDMLPDAFLSLTDHAKVHLP